MWVNMDNITNWLNAIYTKGLGLDLRIINSLITILVLWLLFWLTTSIISKRVSDKRTRYQWRKITGYFFFLVGLLVIGRIWIAGFQSLATYLGLLSAGLAIALKDPISDLFGWIFIMWRRPFEVGDRIEIGEVAGDVVDQRIFQFSLMEIGNWVHADQSTGRLLHVPNQVVFTSVLANYTKGSDYIWNELPVLITFESDWQKAKNLLLEIANQYAKDNVEMIESSFEKATRRFLIEYGKLTPTVYSSVEESGVELTIRYLCEPRQRRDSSQIIWEAILKAFAVHKNIDFAYPTQRFYSHHLEYEHNSPVS